MIPASNALCFDVRHADAASIHAAEDAEAVSVITTGGLPTLEGVLHLGVPILALLLLLGRVRGKGDPPAFFRVGLGRGPGWSWRLCHLGRRGLSRWLRRG